MKDFFKDNLKTANKIRGMYDNYKDEYVLSLDANTLSYDESVRGWVSFYSYQPSYGFTINKEFFTINDEGDLWKHYDNETYNSFYNFVTNSHITTVVNAEPSIVKNFNAINYEGR